MYVALHFSGSSALFLFVLITFSPSPLHSLPLPLPLSFLLLFALVQGVPVAGDPLGFPDLWVQHPERESPVSPQTWIMTCVPLLWTFSEFFCLFPTPLNLGVWPGWGLGPPCSPFSSSCHFLSVPSAATLSLSYAEFSPPTTSRKTWHSDL